MENTSSFDSRDGSMLFIGRIDNRPYPTGSGNNELKRSLVYSTSLYGANAILNNPTGYSGAAVMSIDGLLRPVSVLGQEGLPRYGAYNTGCYLSGPKSSLTPLYIDSTGNSQIYNLNINQSYLNPLTNPTGFLFSSRYEMSGTGWKGHDIELVGHPTSGTGVGFSMVTSIGNGSGIESYSNDYKFVALRGPMVIQGWGYDTNGKPIPNQADNYNNAIQGIYTSANLQDYFLPHFLQKSETWPVGPVDLRWDRNRGVWVSPPSNQLVVGIATGDMAGGTTGRIRVPGTFYNGTGSLISNGYIPVSLYPNFGLYSGQTVISYFDNNSCTYYPLIHKPPSIIDNSGCYKAGGGGVGLGFGSQPMNVKTYFDGNIGLGTGMFLTISGDTKVINAAQKYFVVTGNNSTLGIYPLTYPNGNTSPYFGIGPGFELMNTNNSTDCLSIPTIIPNLRTSGNGFTNYRFHTIGAGSGLYWNDIGSSVNNGPVQLRLNAYAAIGDNDTSDGNTNGINYLNLNFGTGFWSNGDYNIGNSVFQEKIITQLTPFTTGAGGVDILATGTQSRFVGSEIFLGPGLYPVSDGESLGSIGGPYFGSLSTFTRLGIRLGLRTWPGGGPNDGTIYRLQAGPGIVLSAGDAEGTLMISTG